MNADGYDDLVFVNENSTSSESVPIYISFSSGGSYYYLSCTAGLGDRYLWRKTSRIIGAEDIDNDGAGDLLVRKDDASSMSVYIWQSNKTNGFSKMMASPWFEIENNDLPYNVETQSHRNRGLGTWKLENKLNLTTFGFTKKPFLYIQLMDYHGLV